MYTLLSTELHHPHLHILVEESGGKKSSFLKKISSKINFPSMRSATPKSLLIIHSQYPFSSQGYCSNWNLSEDP